MTEDARFEDGAEKPIRLRAFSSDDLGVISALCQDAVFLPSEIAWDKRHRRFAVLLNRFRWELGENLRPERVQSVLSVEDVENAATQGFDRDDADLVLSLLSIEFAPGDDGAGHVELTLAGDGGIRLGVEALEVTLRDVTRPYYAPSGQRPSH